MPDIRTKPPTKEYEQGWKRIFSNKEEIQTTEIEKPKSEDKSAENTGRDK